MRRATVDGKQLSGSSLIHHGMHPIQNGILDCMAWHTMPRSIRRTKHSFPQLVACWLVTWHSNV